MKIKIIPCLEDNYSYLIIDEEKNISCVVDPSEHRPIEEYLDKNNINLKFILNTHHHFDHVGGNNRLKEKYKCKIVGFANDKGRIPGIDVLLDDGEIWMYENFVAKVLHVPGHTLGHICFHFFKDKIVFTGDTLFSLGCGRIFEGTNEQMFNSLKILKKLPSDTKVFCGHEYTLQNSNFCIANDPNNKRLKDKIIQIKRKLQKNIPTVPSTIKEELECNIFLRSENLKNFSKLRDLKDNF